MESVNPTTIDLEPFCDPDINRYALAKPWVVAGWRYATDGSVMIRVPATGEPDTPPVDRRRRPNPIGIIPPDNGDEEYQPWPEVERCFLCGGSLKMPCDNCHGNGTCNECKCEHEHDCGYCDGDGETSCNNCNGVGSFKQTFGKAELALKYVWMISRLPKVMYLPQENPEGNVKFKFDGGEGVVCSLRK